MKSLAIQILPPPEVRYEPSLDQCILAPLIMASLFSLSNHHGTFSPPGFNVSACSVQASPIKLDEDAKGSSTILASIKQERGSPSTAARPLKKTKPLPTSPLSVDLVHQDVVPDSPSLHSTLLSPSSFLALRERLCYQGHRSYTPSWYYQLSDFHGPSHGRGVPHLHQGWSSRRRLRRKG